MAPAKLLRTRLSSVARWPVTDPLPTQDVPRPMPIPATRANSYSRQALKWMSSAPSWSRTRRAGCCARSAAAISSSRLRAGRGGTRHWPSRDTLSAGSATAPLMASWSPTKSQLVGRTVMVSPRSLRHQAGIGEDRWSLGDRVRGEPDLRGQVRVRETVPVGHRIPEGDHPSGGRRGRAVGASCSVSPGRRRRPQAQRARRPPRPRPGRCGAPRLARSADLPSTNLVRPPPRRQRGCDLSGWTQAGGSRTRQPLWPPKPKEFERTALGSQGCGAPCTIGSVISGSGSS